MAVESFLRKCHQLMNLLSILRRKRSVLKFGSCKVRLTQSKFPGESNIVCSDSEGADKEPRFGCSPYSEYSEACIIVSDESRFHSWLPSAEVGKTGPIESIFVSVS